MLLPPTYDMTKSPNPNASTLFEIHTSMIHDILYKYLDVNGALSMIVYKELQFTNPQKFNDPFDCHPSLLDHHVPEDLRRDWPTPDFMAAKSENDSVNLRRRAWVCSLAKRHDNMLMWSYYNNHKGVCIALDNERMMTVLTPGSLGGMCYMNNEVEYRDIVERPTRWSLEDTLKYQLCTKATEWKHEEEVRHIVIDPSSSFVPHRIVRPTKPNEIIDWCEVRFYPKLQDACFKAIYLGVNILEIDKLKVILAAKGSLPDVPIYQMIRDDAKFGFREELVDVDSFIADHADYFKKTTWQKIKDWFPFKVTFSVAYKRPRRIRRTFRM